MLTHFADPFFRPDLSDHPALTSQAAQREMSKLNLLRQGGRLPKESEALLDKAAGDETLRVALLAAMALGRLSTGLSDSAEVKRLLDEYQYVSTRMGKGAMGYLMTAEEIVRAAQAGGGMAAVRGPLGALHWCYVLGMTFVSPLATSLSAGRALASVFFDVDLSMSHCGREAAIKHLQAKYGMDRVCGLAATVRIKAEHLLRQELGDAKGKVVWAAIKELSDSSDLSCPRAVSEQEEHYVAERLGLEALVKSSPTLHHALSSNQALSLKLLGVTAELGKPRGHRKNSAAVVLLNQGDNPPMVRADSILGTQDLLIDDRMGIEFCFRKFNLISSDEMSAVAVAKLDSGLSLEKEARNGFCQGGTWERIFSEAQKDGSKKSRSRSNLQAYQEAFGGDFAAKSVAWSQLSHAAYGLAAMMGPNTTLLASAAPLALKESEAWVADILRHTGGRLMFQEDAVAILARLKPTAEMVSDTELEREVTAAGIWKLLARKDDQFTAFMVEEDYEHRELTLTVARLAPFLVNRAHSLWAAALCYLSAMASGQ